MFHVGRYDPREEDRKEKSGRRSEKAKIKGRKKSVKRDVPQKKRRRREHVPRSQRPAAPTSEEMKEKPMQPETIDKENDLNDLTTGMKKSIKKFHSHAEDSDSSSSVPSSTTDDDSDDSEADMKFRKPSAMHVIAPEQRPASSIRTKPGDEAFDDFDIEDDLLGRSNETPEHTTQSEPSESAPLSAEIGTALHMSKLPIREAAAAWDLAPFLVENLEKDGYEHFFPIQSLVIPDVISSERRAHIRARDVCVAAPTGSGKTLAFVLPVLNSLSKRKIRRLRALVVLPSRDLATQVYQVFERYVRGSDLRVGLAIGRTDFVAEQEALTVGPPQPGDFGDVGKARHRLFFHRGDISLALEAFPGLTDAEEPLTNPKGGRSAVDVLVATPGRLVDHLDKTPGFTLQHLRFLVIDEADRLVNQSYHSWIGRVVDAANSASVEACNELEQIQVRSSGHPTLSPLEVSLCGSAFVIDPITWRRGSSRGDSSSFSTNDTLSSVVGQVCQPVQLRKLLYSATLTKDPQKLASLGLVNAKHFDAHHLNAKSQSRDTVGHQKYSMPPGLAEHTVECTAEQKPLVLLALLLELTMSTKSHSGNVTKGIVVVFTSSLDSTHRLTRLLQLLWAGATYGPQESIAEFSSALNQKQRSSLMKRCNSSDGDVSVVVCSDGMSRGMDIPSVSAVVNYDVPSFAKTYVHRCGRTARAGREGTAISLLKGGQVSQFNRMRNLIGSPDRVSSYDVNKEPVRSVLPVYRWSIKTLRTVIAAETEGELDTMSAIPEELIFSP